MRLSQSNANKIGAFERQSLRQRTLVPKVARALMVLISSFLVFATIWSAKTEMGVLVRAEGEIAPMGELRRVDHFDGGVVVDLLVTVGTIVAANQPLAIIEDPGLKNEITELEDELAFLNKEISNLIWLLEGGDNIDVSPATEAQRELFIARQEMMKRRNSKLLEAMEIAAAIRENAQEQILLSESSLARLRILYDRGVISQTQLLVEEEEIANSRAEYLRSDASYSKTKLDASEADINIHEALLTFQEKHLQSLNELEKSRNLIQVKLGGLRAKKARQIVRSPEGGVIQSSFATTIGEVVPAGATLFELLPSGERLVANVKIDPKDVGHIQVGSSVSIKVTTFDARRYGEVQGKIELISPTSVTADDAAAYYKAVVSLDKITVGSNIDEKFLRAGMTLNAEVETSKRTVLSYLLKPVQNAFERSMIER